jgi:hypothetical protein
VTNSGSVKGIAVQADGTIIGVGMDGTLLTRATLTSGWVQVANSGTVIAIAALKEVTIIGVGTDNLLYTRAGLTAGWAQVPNSGAVKAVAVMLDGTILGVGTQGDLWTRARLTAGWVNVPNSGTVLGVAVLPGSGQILGVGTDNKLYYRTSLSANWTLSGNAGASLIAITVMPDTTVVGVGTDNQLYTLASLSSNWVQVPNSGSVKGVAALPNGTLVGVDTSGNLWTRAGIAAGWVQVPSSGTVIGVAVLTGDSQSLAFNMQHQQTSMWCWDASTVSVAAFYDPSTAWTQCSLANSWLGRNDCCPAGVAPSDNTVPAGCIQGSWPDGPLTRVGHLDGTTNGVLTPAGVGVEIGDSEPIVVDIRWANGGGHIVVLRGRFLAGMREYLHVSDPANGDSDVSYSSFLNSYLGSGTWTHTYTTKA